MNWAGTEWSHYWQEIAGAIGGLSALAALPKIGPPIRAVLMAFLRIPIAQVRLQQERLLKEMYKASLKEMTEEFARYRARQESATESSDSSAASPAPRKKRPSSPKEASPR